MIFIYIFCKVSVVDIVTSQVSNLIKSTVEDKPHVDILFQYIVPQKLILRFARSDWFVGLGIIFHIHLRAKTRWRRVIFREVKREFKKYKRRRDRKHHFCGIHLIYTKIIIHPIVNEQWWIFTQPLCASVIYHYSFPLR